MVNIDMNQPNVVQTVKPNLYPNIYPNRYLTAEPDLPDSPKNEGRQPNQTGDSTDDEGIEDMFTNSAVITPRPVMPSITPRPAMPSVIAPGVPSLDIEGAR